LNREHDGRADLKTAKRCDTKGCDALATETVPDRILPHVKYPLCKAHADGLRLLQRFVDEGAIVDVRP
jgi:hypothetical protein